MLKSNQGVYHKGADWESYVEVDGNLLTGQNPASSEAVANEMINQLLKKQGWVKETSAKRQAPIRTDHGIDVIATLPEP